MKRKLLFIVYLALLSVISGHLLSKASWIGRVGMTFFYKEYNLLKIWWQGAAAVFMFLMLLFFIHDQLQRRLTAITARAVHILLLLVAAACLYFTYNDFTNDFSHHLLGRRFHYGFYLIWFGWISTCIFFVLKKKSTTTVITTNSDKTETTGQ